MTLRGDFFHLWLNGMRSFVGKLAAVMSLLSSIPIVLVQECQSYSRFHSYSHLMQIRQQAFARFLIPLEE